MQMVIDIPDEWQEWIKQGCFGARIPNSLYVLAGAVMNGVVLPKGHGTLDDADELSKQAETPLKYLEYVYTGARACDDVEEQVRLARAIAAYKQDVHEDCTVLDKLKAEIEQMDFDFGDFYDNTDAIIEMVCKVIDKYREEQNYDKGRNS